MTYTAQQRAAQQEYRNTERSIARQDIYPHLDAASAELDRRRSAVGEKAWSLAGTYTGAEDVAEAAVQARYDAENTVTLMYDSDEGTWLRRCGLSDPAVRKTAEAYIADGRSPLRRRVRRCCISAYLWAVRHILRADHIWVEEVS